MRNEKGITLVALILIIVVLLILAGISISLVVNNEANQVEIDPNSQRNTQTESLYDMQEVNTANEVQDTINEVDVDGSDVEENNVGENTAAPENTVVNGVEENTVEPENVVE